MNSNIYKYTIQWVSSKHRIDRLSMGKAVKAKPSEASQKIRMVAEGLCRRYPDRYLYGTEAATERFAKGGLQSSFRPAGTGRSATEMAPASMAFEVPFKTPYMAVRFALLRASQGQEHELPPPNSHPRRGCGGSYRPPDPRRGLRTRQERK